MAILETVAKAFQIPPQVLLQESLRTYLKQKLLKVESDLFVLSKKYGVHDVLQDVANMNSDIISSQCR